MFFPTACCDGGKGRGGKEKKERGGCVEAEEEGEKSVFETANLADVDQVGVGFGLLSTKLRHDSVKR